VDTGTTLLGLDSFSYESMFAAIAELNLDCSDLSKFPTLNFKIGDGEIVLPPRAYIGEVAGLTSTDHLGHLMRLDKPSPFKNAVRLHEDGQKVMCQLLTMDMGTMMTSIGPEMILGMAVFREYYVTFDLGSGRDDRHIFFSPANDQCDPMSAEDMQMHDLRGEHFGHREDASISSRPMKIDASKIRVPKKFDGNL